MTFQSFVKLVTKDIILVNDILDNGVRCVFSHLLFHTSVVMSTRVVVVNTSLWSKLGPIPVINLVLVQMANVLELNINKKEYLQLTKQVL